MARPGLPKAFEHVVRDGRMMHILNSRCDGGETGRVGVLIIDGDLFVRKGLVDMLDELADISVRGVGQDFREACDFLDREPVDVLLMGLESLAKDEFSMLEEMLRRFPDLKVFLLGSSIDVRMIRKLMGLGLRGFLLKSSESDHIVQGIRLAMIGFRIISDDVMEELFPSEEAFPIVELSAGEKDVLSLVAKGKSNSEIAKELFIAESTVKARLSKASSKLGVSSRVTAALRARELGIV